jgi:outer membrane protein, heavy metal efflux system
MRVRIILAGIAALSCGLPVWAQNPTPLPDLLAEAVRNNSDVHAAEHTWQAGTHVRQQVATLPNPQFTLQEFSVGSPKPFAGFNTSDFAYFGIGASQELPYPGKLRLKGEAADRAAGVQQAHIAVARASIADGIKAA